MKAKFKNVIELVEYKVCSKCKLEVTNTSYCKNCEPKAIKFKFKNTQLVKVGLDKLKYSVTNPPTFQFVQCDLNINPNNINILSQIEQGRFYDLGHLTSYIIESNRFPVSRLLGSRSSQICKLPSIKYIIDSNLYLIPLNEPDRDNRIIGLFNYGLSEVYNPKFWTELIRLYLIEWHPLCPIFNLNSLNLQTMSQSLLTAVYCVGYLHYPSQTRELTDYINHLAKRNVNRATWKTSIANLQALILHHQIFDMQSRVDESNAYIMHLIRMSYSLGIHSNTSKFNFVDRQTRKLIYWIMIKQRGIMNTIHKSYPIASVEFPKFSPCDYDPQFHLLHDDVLKSVNITKEEAEFISLLTTQNMKYSDKTLEYVYFEEFTNISDENLEDMCFERYRQLTKDYALNIKGYLELEQKCSKYTNIYTLDSGSMEAYYLYLSLLIFEYARHVIKSPSHKLIAQTIEICEKLLEITLTRPENNYLPWFTYLSALTYMTLVKYLLPAKKQKFISNFNLLKLILSEYAEGTNTLTYLIFDQGLKQIK
ncbi:hypothetical protein CONCODRAFT_4805 [Conidiobolus coronatus NRRL 28638]|uniref:Xylanolytic transcriptional activator regulatory domain-containing protein n=1 Tax=Conidiobolus coronatus (strain ATCC 28846 / CBS 209.66 / NRRL 28638) TaxID=796925 RepID=A0A137PBH9_CONC2|nr:hypothetical protein CONCODRAFT_4805 [Conidiobolus coronatus NRRL 28638]|eukprot:KXN72363.1 hypothetical protein CONCODRAFT_4805 [Conidiobolus coronatus NRRL 28638]